MLINFNDLFLLPSKVNGIIHIGAHNLEELPDYVKGNVRVISNKANRLKNDGDYIDLLRISEWLKKELEK